MCRKHAQRDRENTERCLIEAAKSIIREKGLEAVGVTAVSDRVGFSKVLIYRYFGDLNGLLEKVGQELDPANIRGVLSMIDLRSDTEWERLASVMAQMISGLMN